ncbi:hypothetical protein [Pandoraea anhela]|uniref:Poly(A) polymerase I n=1 Tax=Pandoraea anhela TaxID=2508295 RepID=A0A5E4T1H5_9BURK|nr:hypothetical protein [Pandoraea anhela]VVD81301.1 Poly(A) polymerase I [Pandoraea anhela]
MQRIEKDAPPGDRSTQPANRGTPEPMAAAGRTTPERHPHADRQRRIQAIANNSPRLQSAAQLRTMMDQRTSAQAFSSTHPAPLAVPLAAQDAAIGVGATHAPRSPHDAAQGRTPVVQLSKKRRGGAKRSKKTVKKSPSKGKDEATADDTQGDDAPQTQDGASDEITAIAPYRVPDKGTGQNVAGAKEARQTLDAMRENFYRAATGVLRAAGVDGSGAPGTSVADLQALAFEDAVSRAVDITLPALLRALPFGGAGAAIRFAYNMMLERLRVEPVLASQDKPAQEKAVEAFLIAAVEALGPVDSDGEDDEMDDDAQDGEKPRVDLKRHQAAKANVAAIVEADAQASNEHITKYSQTRAQAQTSYLYSRMMEVPVIAGLRGRESKAKGIAFINDQRRSELSFDAADKLLVKLAVTLDFRNGVELLHRFRTTPVADAVTAHRIRLLLRTRFNKEFDSHPLATPITDALVALNLVSNAVRGELQPKSEVARQVADDLVLSDHFSRIGKMELAFNTRRQEAVKRDTAQDEKKRQARHEDLLQQFDALKFPRDTLERVAKLLGVVLPKPKSEDAAADRAYVPSVELLLFTMALTHVQSGATTDVVQTGFENLLFRANLDPGSERREAVVMQLKADKLLAGVDPEVLSRGAKSIASLKRDAVQGGWATAGEIDICSRLLGPRAFIGILGSHMARRKYGPLRSIIEQTIRHREAVAVAPPMTNRSLALDTNTIEILLPTIKEVPDAMKYRREQLNDIIVNNDIQDIRLANMNVAELGEYGRLIGRTLDIEVLVGSVLSRRKLTFMGVPFSKNRAGGAYSRLFKELETKKVGENKGHADRSMMADLFLAEREEGHVPHFASADQGVGDEIGDKKHQFNPKALKLPPLNIVPIKTKRDEPSTGAKASTAGGATATDSTKAAASGIDPVAKTPPKSVSGATPSPGSGSTERPHRLGEGNAIYGFEVGGTHTVAEITKLITDETYGRKRKKHFEVYVVGGAVRDYLRGSKVKDVDVKTNMPVKVLQNLLEKHKLPYHTTIKDGLYLVTVSEEPHSLDIVCATQTQEAFDALHHSGKERLDLRKDALERDFTINALYLDSRSGFAPSRGGEQVIDPLDAGGIRDARSGKLRLVADRTREDGADKDDGASAWLPVPIQERAQRIVEHLLAHPEEFGRTLKFLDRGHTEWEAQGRKTRTVSTGKGGAGKSHAIDTYHLDTEVLDILRSNAEIILHPLVTELKEDTSAIRGEDVKRGSSPAARKNFFFHKTGFSTPMELVEVMQRLHFSAHVIQLLIPDTVAGEYGSGELAYNRNVSPRNRPTGSPSAWDPKAAPKVKVDMQSGALYQHRIYACLPSETQRYAADAADKTLTRILIDVDYTNHAVSGHPAPHHHVFRDIGGKWVKNESGFSNTGQPGLPSVAMEDGIYVYHGPTPWLWRPAPGQDDDSVPDSRFVELVEAACQDASLTFENHNDGVVTIGKQLRIPVARLRQIDARDAEKGSPNKYRLARLLTLIRTLNAGDVNTDDDSLKYFTQSKRGGERLRFQVQLEKVDDFMAKSCGFARKGPEIASLTHEERLRLYDLLSAGYGELESAAAARYAKTQLAGKFDAHLFVEYFEFYMAAVASRVSGKDVAELNRRMIRKSRSTVVGPAVALSAKGQAAADDVIEAAIKDKQAALRFTSEQAAAYHIVKHREVTGEDPKALETNAGAAQAGKHYIDAATGAVANGKVEKTVRESASTRVFFFKANDVTTIVEARLDKDTWHARILSCYGKNDEQDVVVGSPFIDVPSSSGLSGLTAPHGGAKSGAESAQVDNVLRTDFGLLYRVPAVTDGNCFFDSVRLSAGLPQSAARLREMAAAQIHPASEADQRWLAPFVTGSQSDEAKLKATNRKIKQNGFWADNAGDFVPYLMARALARPIYIVSGINGRLITVAGGGAGQPIVVFYNGANHYDATAQAGPGPLKH